MITSTSTSTSTSIPINNEIEIKQLLLNNNWEIRTNHKVIGSNSDKQNFKYVICDISLLPIDYILVIEPLLIGVVDSLGTYKPMEDVLHAWGIDKEQTLEFLIECLKYKCK